MSAPSTQPETTASPSARTLALVVPLILAALAVVGFFVYPGHTLLESDSQIFMPVLLHRMNPALFTQDILISSLHTTYTLWDELALGLHGVTRLPIESVLFLLQIAFRFVGLLGVFWVLEALFAGRNGQNGNFVPQSAMPGAQSRWLALAGTAIYGLGAFIVGPSLLTIEYEPVPRAFSLPCVLLGLGFVARGRFVAAGLAGACAYLLHPPTSLAFWAVYLLAALVHTEEEKRWHGLALLPLAGAVLQFFAWLEPAAAEPQQFFSRIDTKWESLQRLRGAYVFPSGWHPSTLWFHACLAVIVVLAYLRVRNSAEARLRTFLWALPLAGVLSIPLAWLLLDKMKWSLMPQLQPMRYTLYLALFAIVLGYAAGMLQAIRHGRYIEAAAWFMMAFSIGFQYFNVLWLTPLLAGLECGSLLPPFGEAACCRASWPLAPKQASVLEGGSKLPHSKPARSASALAIAVGLLLAAAVIWLRPAGFVAWSPPNLRVLGAAAGLSALLLVFALACRSLPRLAPIITIVVVATLLLSAPHFGRTASLNLSAREIQELGAWAFQSTPENSVFLFADAGRSLEPGVFRYQAQRATYVDWKGGGQVNYFRAFGDEWWERWRAVAECRYSAAKNTDYRRLGINYLVFKKLPARLPGPVVYRNSAYMVVSLR